MDIKLLFIDKNVSLVKAIEKLDKTAKKILLVVEKNKLIGVITDGDVRRWILKKGDLLAPAKDVMNANPIYLKAGQSSEAKEIMAKYGIESIPIVNESMEVIDIAFLNQLLNNKINNNKNTSVVIMAGGKGTRLKPYTNIIPKALIPIGDTPIIERIINKFMEFGFENFYISVNDKKEIIKAYFSRTLPYSISFLEEKKPLGTAGALWLLNHNVSDTFFVSNCDILINANYSKILEYHKKNNNKITIISALKNYIIPYGVLKLKENGEIETVNEKPKYELLVNTGMYVLEADVLKYVPKNQYFDMPDLIKICLSNSEKVGTYPVMDNDWLDMGEFKEMKNMLEKLKI